ncbi:MAG TPA: dihydropteroate synthase, partial [Acidimicrobiales bacterium]|nr:dihydropteroate synthase [Acidimicrobiales bacterium]
VYADVVGEVRCFLAERVERARAAGVAQDRIIVDAGLDLGKTPAQSLQLLHSSAGLADLGPPLLLSASNKRFLGELLGLGIDERRLASHAAHALGISRGCRLVRVHDVRGARRVAAVLEALLTARRAQLAQASRRTESADA